MIKDDILTDSIGRIFDLSIVYYRKDGSYVVTLKHPTLGDLPYHVPNMGEYKELYDEITEWRINNEDHFVPEPEVTIDTEDTSTTNTKLQ